MLLTVNTSWDVLTEKTKDVSWNIFILTTKNTIWNICKRMTKVLSWHIINPIAYAQALGIYKINKPTQFTCMFRRKK